MLNVIRSNTKAGRTNEIQTYIGDVKRFPILSRDEEKEVAIRAIGGDKEASNKLIQSNLLLIVKIANEYGGIFDNLNDLIQEGSLGALRALSKFDPNKGIRFSSYAIWYARAMMLKYMFNNSHMIKPGTTPNQRRLFYRLRKEQSRLKALGIEADSSVIAKNLDVDENEVIDVDSRLHRDVFIDAPVIDEDGTADGVIGDFIAMPTDNQPDSLVESQDFRTELRICLGKFATKLKSDKYREIYFKRIAADEPETFQALADRLGISRQRVEQLEKVILISLKKYLERYDFKDY